MQKQLSFAVGWLTALGWQCAMPSVAYTGAQQVLAFIAVCDRDYVIQGWHGALLTMAFVLAAIFFNTSAIGKLPILEGLAVVFHTFGFFAFIIIIWVMGPRAGKSPEGGTTPFKGAKPLFRALADPEPSFTDAHTTFTTFADDNGWGSIGAATLIAIVAPTTTYLGADSAVHLAEELKDASHVLPRAMVSAATINYVTGFVATVTLMSNLGDVDEVLADPSGQPWVAVVYRATGSKAATLVLIVVMIVLVRCRKLTLREGAMLIVRASTSSARSTKLPARLDRSGRKLDFIPSTSCNYGIFLNRLNTLADIFTYHSFARDRGLPFHTFLSKVRPNSGVPANAVYVTLAFTCILALIIIGSTAAFNIILSVSATGLFTSYLVCVLCVLAKRLRGEVFPATKFSLGKAGLPINAAAVCFLMVAYFFLFFPAVPNPAPADMNWAILIVGQLH